jgi:hypothetical protein
VDNPEASGSVGLLSIHNLNIPHLIIVRLDFQSQEAFLERKWHTGSVDQYLLDGR